MAAEAHKDPAQRIRELEQRLAESEETLRALREGEVDAFVVSGPGRDRVYTLKGADEPYRLMVQEMAEGAVTVRRDGLILFSNQQFAAMVGVALDRVIGSRLHDFVAIEDYATLSAVLAARSTARVEINLKTGSHPITSQMSLSSLHDNKLDYACVVITDLTEPKQRENLVASEELARSILEQAAEAMVVAGPEGLILRANSAAAALAGKSGLLYPFDQVFGLRLGSAPYPFRKILAAVERGETIKGLEVTASFADGRLSVLLLSAAALKGADPRLIGCVIGLTDITARKAAEKTLRASEANAKRQLAEIEAIYESAPVGLALLDTSLCFVRVNQRFAEINGWPADAHIGKRRGDLNPDLRGAAEEAMRRVLHSGKPLLDFEVRGSTATQPGVQRIWNEKWVPVRNENGAIVGIVIRAEEITAKRQAEEALRASVAAERARAAELQAIMDAAPAITLITRDAESRHMVGNRMAYEILHLPPGTNISLSAPEGERPANFRAARNGREISPGELPVQRAAATGQPVRNEEFELLFDDGRSSWLLGDAVPLVGEDGAPQGAVGAFLDITDRKRTEQRLRETQKLESIGLLAGGIAHDFNNLLTGILGNASLALDLVPEGGDVAQRLQAVMKSGERAAHLTKQMLDYSGKGNFIAEPVNLSNFVRQVAGMLRPKFLRPIP